MKRIILILLALLCCVTMIGCRQKPSTTVYEQDGYTVDLDAGTITKGEDVYTFSISGSGNQTSINIIYPNVPATFSNGPEIADMVAGLTTMTQIDMRTVIF